MANNTIVTSITTNSTAWPSASSMRSVLNLGADMTMNIAHPTGGSFFVEHRAPWVICEPTLPLEQITFFMQDWERTETIVGLLKDMKFAEAASILPHGMSVNMLSFYAWYLVTKTTLDLANV